jgi:hypothetical protein
MTDRRVGLRAKVLVLSKVSLDHRTMIKNDKSEALKKLIAELLKLKRQRVAQRNLAFAVA